MTKPIYLDYAATTPVDPRVAKVMCDCLTLDGNFANPASRSHMYGWQAEASVENARRQVADVIHADTREIVWTSGATEANNLAIKGFANAHAHIGKHLITSLVEHKAVLDCFEYLESVGFDVTYLKPNGQGVVSVSSVESALREDTILVSLMHVNNELGVINDVAEIGRLLKDKPCSFHVDAAQSVGKIEIDVKSMAIDMLSLCAHKVYGPKGVGALYVRRQPPLNIDALIHGGGHERGMRSGTLPTHQIVGMGAALAIASTQMKEDRTRISSLSAKFLNAVLAIDGVTLNGRGTNSVPNIVNLCFEGFEADRLMMVFKDLAVASGSACTSASLDPSHVLRAIGLPDTQAHSCLRISFGRFSTDEEIERAIQVIQEGICKLKKL